MKSDSHQGVTSLQKNNETILYAASRLTHEYACSMASSRVELGESKTRTKQEQEWN